MNTFFFSFRCGHRSERAPKLLSNGIGDAAFFFSSFVCIIEWIGRHADDLGRARALTISPCRSIAPTENWIALRAISPVQSMLWQWWRAVNEIESNKNSVTMQILFLIFRRRYFYGDVKLLAKYTYLRGARRDTRRQREIEREWTIDAVL